jgi:hypothetical protein
LSWIRTVIARLWPGNRIEGEDQEAVDHSILEQLPLPAITRVVFFKRDEITTDLICVEIELVEKTWFFHEVIQGWDLLIAHLEKLPGFNAEWYALVSQPPFKPSRTVAFERD